MEKLKVGEGKFNVGQQITWKSEFQEIISKQGTGLFLGLPVNTVFNVHSVDKNNLIELSVKNEKVGTLVLNPDYKWKRESDPESHEVKVDNAGEVVTKIEEKPTPIRFQNNCFDVVEKTADK
jgi:hypothetical protein